ncbi:potassium transporter [Erysipelotrichaceae bacterium MTC7]|nr:potassium transporter [Erysipelotrichaceae bacterium MTC7]
MLTSFAYMFLLGIIFSAICKKLHLPSLIGMMATGMLLGPYVLNCIDGQILEMSDDLRQIALIIILTRAGLSLNLQELKSVGRSAILMCFVPACFEIIGVMLIAPPLLHISLLDAAILGSVLAAVSPAVIVPRMIQIMNNGYGTKQGIPQMVLAGASVDDVFVIVIFTACTTLATGNHVDATSFINVPISILLGIAVGFLVGYLLTKLFQILHLRDTIKIVILMSTAFLLLQIQDQFPNIPFSALLAIMSMAIATNQFYSTLASRLQFRYDHLWVVAEFVLFILVGASINISYIQTIGVLAILLLLFGLLFRMVGVLICLVKSKLNRKERIFTMIAYTPKATVQAALGPIPLSMGLACGDLVLAVSILAILLTAPLGAFAIDSLYKKLLQH